MKKILMTIAVVAALMAVSCKKEEVVQPQQPQTPVPAVVKYRFWGTWTHGGAGAYLYTTYLIKVNGDTVASSQIDPNWPTSMPNHLIYPAMDSVSVGDTIFLRVSTVNGSTASLNTELNNNTLPVYQIHLPTVSAYAAQHVDSTTFIVQ